MKKLFAFIMIIAAMLTLASCTDDGIPDNMQLVDGADEKGYYFYSPDGWALSNTNGIATAYVSRVNMTSVSFTEKDAESFGTIADDGCGNESCKGTSLDAKAHYFLYHYFSDSFAPIKENAEKSFTLHSSGDVIFGAENYRADRAVKYDFSYLYTDIGYSENTVATCGFIQFYIVHDGYFYIMTYSATKDVPEGLENSNYSSYLDELDMITANFKFVEKAPATESDQTTEATKDADGFTLVSDGALSGFMFYSSPDFVLDYSSAIVSVSHEDGSNVNLTKVPRTRHAALYRWRTANSP